MNPIYESEFYHDGRGPELIKFHYNSNGSCICAADFFNPEDTHDPDNIKSMRFVRPQSFMITPEEEFDYQNMKFIAGNHAAIWCLGKSEWYKSFSNRHSQKCQHFRIMFYDDYLDIICENIEFEKRGFKASYIVVDTFSVLDSTKSGQLAHFPNGVYAVLEKKLVEPSLPNIGQQVKIIEESSVIRTLPVQGIFKNPQGIISILFENGGKIEKGQVLELA